MPGHSSARAPLALTLALASLRCAGGEAEGSGTTGPATTTSASTTSGSSGSGGGASSSGGGTGESTTTTTTTTTTSGDATGSSASGATDAGTSAASTGAATTSGEGSSTSTGGEGSSTSSTGGGEPVCGDGVVDGGEACDDGNDVDADACLGDCTPGQAVLALTGAGEAPGVLARFVPGAGWSISQAGVTMREAALAPTPSGAVAVVRRDGPWQQDKDELAFADWSPEEPALLTNFADVGVFGFGVDGPSLASVAETVTLAFLGTDNKHYTALRTMNGWSPFAPLPAGMVQIQAFGPSAAALASGVADTYAVYAGDDSKLYYSYKASPGGAWQASSQTGASAVVNGLTPAILVDEEGDLLIAYVRKADSKIAVVKLITPQNAWSAEVIVHPQATTGAELALLRSDGGAYYLAYKGLGESVHVVRGSAYDQWGAPTMVAEPQALTSAPALARGALGADAELVYVRGGYLHHARLVGDEASEVAEVPGDGKLAARPAALRVLLKP